MMVSFSFLLLSSWRCCACSARSLASHASWRVRRPSSAAVSLSSCSPLPCARLIDWVGLGVGWVASRGEARDRRQAAGPGTSAGGRGQLLPPARKEGKQQSNSILLPAPHTPRSRAAWRTAGCRARAGCAGAPPARPREPPCQRASPRARCGGKGRTGNKHVACVHEACAASGRQGGSAPCGSIAARQAHPPPAHPPHQLRLVSLQRGPLLLLLINLLAGLAGLPGDRIQPSAVCSKCAAHSRAPPARPLPLALHPTGLRAPA